eukprot:91550-Prymnesium_polylepis.1
MLVALAARPFECGKSKTGDGGWTAASERPTCAQQGAATARCRRARPSAAAGTLPPSCTSTS